MPVGLAVAETDHRSRRALAWDPLLSRRPPHGDGLGALHGIERLPLHVHRLRVHGVDQHELLDVVDVGSRAGAVHKASVSSPRPFERRIRTASASGSYFPN